MGSWGITERESDYGLDLLNTIATKQLKATDFAAFNVAEALDIITADIMEQIRKANRGCSAESLVYYFGISFPQSFTHGALLIAECLADYYRTGELIITDYDGETQDMVDHHIKAVIVTKSELKILFDELRKVQDPDHEIYQSWHEDNDREKWLSHIQFVQWTLQNHIPKRETRNNVCKDTFGPLCRT